MKDRIQAAEAPGSGGSRALTHSDALRTMAEMPTIARVTRSCTRVVAGGVSVCSVVIHQRSSGRDPSCKGRDSETPCLAAVFGQDRPANVGATEFAPHIQFVDGARKLVGFGV